MGDIYISRNDDGELTHSARGTTWSKDGASYISRKKVNGKWVYTYGKPGHTVSTRSHELSRRGGRGFTDLDEGRYSSYESLKRQSVSAQRNIEKDPRYKVEAKAAYLKNKASRAARKNVAKGKAKVNEILSRLRKTAKNARAKAVSAKLNREYKKKYVTNRERDAKRAEKKRQIAGKNRSKQYATATKTMARAMYENYNPDVVKAYKKGEKSKSYDQWVAENKKKYKKQAKAQRHTKRVIAREQTVGKAKRTAKAVKSYVTKGWGTGYAGQDKVRSVSKKVDKKNAGKKR